MKRWAATAVAATTGAATMLVGPVTTASADVLYIPPEQHVRLHHAIHLGVWYQQYSGGSRRYRVQVRNPAGRVVWRRHGKATTTWKDWTVRLHRVGRWTVTYWTRDRGAWHPYRTRVRVTR